MVQHYRDADLRPDVSRVKKERRNATQKEIQKKKNTLVSPDNTEPVKQMHRDSLLRFGGGMGARTGGRR